MCKLSVGTGRYALFTEIMQKHGYNVLATAHHAEDQLETVLMQVDKRQSDHRYAGEA